MACGEESLRDPGESRAAAAHPRHRLLGLVARPTAVTLRVVAGLDRQPFDRVRTLSDLEPDAAPGQAPRRSGTHATETNAEIMEAVFDTTSADGPELIVNFWPRAWNRGIDAALVEGRYARRHLPLKTDEDGELVMPRRHRVDGGAEPVEAGWGRNYAGQRAAFSPRR